PRRRALAARTARRRDPAAHPPAPEGASREAPRPAPRLDREGVARQLPRAVDVAPPQVRLAQPTLIPGHQPRVVEAAHLGDGAVEVVDRPILVAPLPVR